jgi:hypothetical protein
LNLTGGALAGTGMGKGGKGQVISPPIPKIAKHKAHGGDGANDGTQSNCAFHDIPKQAAFFYVIVNHLKSPLILFISFASVHLKTSHKYLICSGVVGGLAGVGV